MVSSEHPASVRPKDTSSQTLGQLHHGKGAWYETRDDDGNVKTRFRADEYLPQNNGIVLAKNPEAEFYTGHNQMMRLTGKTGEIVVPDAPDTAKGAGNQPAAAPNRGRIHDVRIEMFGLGPDSKPDKADETLVTDNIQFDNETLLITTESFVDAAGKTVPPDQVPVRMRTNPDHQRYDFDGRGLRLRWNSKDGRLELLEIAHGEQLTVYDTGSFSGAFGGPAAPATQPAVRTSALAVPLPAMLAANDKSVAAAALNAPRPATRPGRVQPAKSRPPSPPVPYQATFFENVLVTQGDEIHVTADQMDVDFLSKQEGAPGPTTAPATAPAAAGSHGDAAVPPAPSEISHAAEVATQPVNQAATRADSATRPAATQPTTQRAQAPLVIRWTGKLTMLPAQSGQRPKLSPGDAVVELTGRPVTLRRTPAGQQEGNEVLCASMVYHTADGSAALRGSELFPEVMLWKLLNGKKDPLSIVTTETLDYAAGKSATLTGRGHATVPVDAAAPDKGVMDAKWARSAKLYFTGKGGPEEMAIEHMDLAGNVDILHPQLALKSQALSLFFEPPPKGPATKPPGLPDGIVDGQAPVTRPATRPARGPQAELRRVIATDTVHCQLTDVAGKKQVIDCDALELHTAHADDGRLFARTIDANGSVHANDGEQDLRAGSVALTLRPAKPADAKPDAGKIEAGKAAGAKVDGAASAGDHAIIAKADSHAGPATRPATQPGGSALAAGELETMTARDHVKVTGKDGAFATSNEMVVTTENGEPHVRLSDPDNAHVVDAKGNIIAGPLITAEPKRQLAHVIGPGMMHFLRDQEDGKKPEPMDVVWTTRADMDGSANRIDVVGEVQADIKDSDGALNHATGDTIHITLRPKPAPATRPATQPALAARAANKPAATDTAQAAMRPATRPARAGTMADSMQMDLMKDKEMKTVTLDGHATVTSTLSDSTGKILRRFSLHGPTIIYSLFDANGKSGRTVLVPAAGQMLVQDHRPPNAPAPAKPAPGNPVPAKPAPGNAAPGKPAPAPVANKNANGAEMDTGRGDTAFQWSKQLLYSELEHNAVMTGDVLIVHQNPEGKEDPVRMNADKVTAWFEPPAAAKAKPVAPAPGVAAAPAPAMVQPAALQLKKITAEGQTVISRGGSQLNANRIDFDPATHWIAASGSKDRPAVLKDSESGKSFTGTQLWWNTQTWDIKMKDPSMANPR
ncbi:MAG: OstA-like protein [Phycisphaerales bacterium]|nr:OstA-like protein [Phycisphaerales bacterium]